MITSNIEREKIKNAQIEIIAFGCIFSAINISGKTLFTQVALVKGRVPEYSEYAMALGKLVEYKLIDVAGKGFCLNSEFLKFLLDNEDFFTDSLNDKNTNQVEFVNQVIEKYQPTFFTINCSIAPPLSRETYDKYCKYYEKRVSDKAVKKVPKLLIKLGISGFVAFAGMIFMCIFASTLPDFVSTIATVAMLALMCYILYLIIANANLFISYELKYKKSKYDSQPITNAKLTYQINKDEIISKLLQDDYKLETFENTEIYKSEKKNFNAIFIIQESKEIINDLNKYSQICSELIPTMDTKYTFGTKVATCLLFTDTVYPEELDELSKYYDYELVGENIANMPIFMPLIYETNTNTLHYKNAKIPHGYGSQYYSALKLINKYILDKEKEEK